MQELIKKFLVNGIKIILILFIFWIIYLTAVFFFPELPDKIKKVLNINQIQNEELKNQTIGERVYNMFSDVKFPQPSEIKNNIQVENKPWILDDKGKQINELNTVNATTVIPETRSH